MCTHLTDRESSWPYAVGWDLFAEHGSTRGCFEGRQMSFAINGSLEQSKCSCSMCNSSEINNGTRCCLWVLAKQISRRVPFHYMNGRLRHRRDRTSAEHVVKVHFLYKWHKMIGLAWLIIFILPTFFLLDDVKINANSR